MKPTARHFAALFVLLVTAGRAGARDGEWVSYRDAYRAMVVFEKYGQAKHLIQSQFQVMSRDGSEAPEGLQLTLLGKSTSLNLPLDATGRTVLPMSTQAYDENAALVLNRKGGRYVFRPRVSLQLRADGVYQAGELRAGCEQALAFQRLADAALRARRCVGVRFVFAKGLQDPGVRLRKGEAAALTMSDGPAFQGDPYVGFRVVDYRFAGGGDKAPVVTQNAPLAINPVYE